ncbi:MAG TPA: hypothetical protein VMU48_19940 [Terracidiphilus sp.]|nr:hypothetical protein [Terracidiphilus sp.]
MTQQAPDQLAIAKPCTELGVRRIELSVRKSPVEVQLGVGPAAHIPTRVLGFCACAVDALTIAERMVGKPVNVRVFSSALKIAHLSGGLPDPPLFLPAITALTLGLRLAGYAGPISADLASGIREVPTELTLFPIPEIIRTFLWQASDHNGNGADPLSYAVEHAGQSMYGDLRDPHEPEYLRITIGGRAEARFWSIRQQVAMLAEREGYSVSPSFGLILRSLKRPWYSPTPEEPLLRDLLNLGVEGTKRALDVCSNPSHSGGNTGLRREARNAKSLLTKPGVFALAEAVSNVSNSAKALLNSDISIGRRLSEALKSSANGME